MASSYGNRNHLNFLLYCTIGIVILSSCTDSVHGQILKRFEHIKEWAQREEKIFSLSKARVTRLKQELAELEKYVEDYEKSTSQHLSGLQDAKLQETVNDAANEITRAEIVASDVILTYRMAHRLSTMIPRMQRAILAIDTEGQELKVHLGAFTNTKDHPNVTFEPTGEDFGQYSSWLPNEDDLEGALDSMAILYDAYNPQVLKTEDFTKMLSAGTSKPVQINAYHATKFSLKAFYHGYYGNAMDWANYANTKLDKERDYSISKELVHYMREFMGKSHNEEILRPPNYFPETISYLNFFTDMVNETKTWEKRKTQIHRLNNLNQNLFDEAEKPMLLTTAYYYAACQRARLESLKKAYPQISQFSCTMTRDTSPYYYLAPLKVETLSKSPKIVQYHDVLSSVQIQNLLVEVGEHHFSSSYILKEFPDEYGTRKPHLRTSMEAVIEKELVNLAGDTGIWRTMARKTEYLTGFRILDNGAGTSYPLEESNDLAFRVSEFVGGGYEAVQRRTDEQETIFGSGIQFYLLVMFLATHLYGNKIHSECVQMVAHHWWVLSSTNLKTLISHCSLHAPEVGGEVVFGGTQTITKPVEGSAIYWENIGQDSLVPMEIYLSSCPVVQGYKIVLSKEFSFSLEQYTY